MIAFSGHRIRQISQEMHRGVISKFGKQWNSRLKTTTDNPGIDIKGQPGSPIRSTMSGIITTINYYFA